MSIYSIKHRWTGATLFSCELSAEVENASLGVKLGFAVKAAYKSGADLRGADLRGADLSGADLRGASLSGASMSGANLSGVPVIKNIHQAVFAAASRPKALDMGSWHSCDTTHCRAGWVTTLAGEGGAAMEFCMGTPAAAALIYLASDPEIERIPDFYADNVDALADMQRLADAEAAKSAKA